MKSTGNDEMTDDHDHNGKGIYSSTEIMDDMEELTQYQLLLLYKKEALEYADEYCYYDSLEHEGELLLRIVNQYAKDRSVFFEIARDLRYHDLYDCLVRWVDPDSGLAAREPEAMLEVARLYLGEPKD